VRLYRWSVKSIGDDDDGDFHFPAVYRRKGTDDWRLLGSPQLDSFHQVDHQTQAHLLDLLTDAGAAPFVGFFLDSGNYCETVARIREVWRAME
jgi:hypothetical protein